MELSEMNKQKIAEVGVMAARQDDVPTPDDAEKIMEAGITTIPVSANSEEAASMGSVFKAVIEEHGHKEETQSTDETAVDSTLAAAAQADSNKAMAYGVMAMPQEVASEADAAAQKAKKAMEDGLTSIRE